MESERLPNDYAQQVNALAGAATMPRAVLGSASSDDGAVRAVVGGDGALRDLSFGPSALSLAPDVLAHAIVATARRARTAAVEAAADALEPQLGRSSAAMRAVRDQVPTSTTPAPAATPPSPLSDSFDSFDDEGGYSRG